MVKVERGKLSIWKYEKNHKTQIPLDLDEELGGKPYSGLKNLWIILY
jgi:hypothetical protein